MAGAIKAAGGEEIEREAMGGAAWAPSAASMHDATVNALRRAGEHGLVSVAFPALGTGLGGFPLRTAACGMAAAVQDFAAAPPATSVQVVIFVLRDAAAAEEFRRGLR